MEFKYDGKPVKGIVFQGVCYGDKLSITCLDQHTYCYWDWDGYSDHKKIGYTDTMPSCEMDEREAIDLTEAYFSKPTFTGSYAEQQAQWVKHHGLKVGDKVKVVRKVNSHKDGWVNCWSLSMDSSVGNCFCIVHMNGSSGIELDDANHLDYPYFALEPVK